MCKAIRLSACSVCVILGVASWGFEVAAAETSASCRELAARFASSQTQLDAVSLARLGTCITTELVKVAGTTEPSTAAPGATASPIPQADVRSPQANGGGTEAPLPHRYGDWPLSAAWMEHWPSPNPW